MRLSGAGMSGKAKEHSYPLPVRQLLSIRRSLVSVESFDKGFNYKPNSSDVIISAVIKGGTTLTQHICHGLRSGGDMSFDEISNVVPSLEQSLDEGYGDLYQQQPYQPHMFKTHFLYRDVPKGAGKYIIVVRKPEDVALSAFHFHDGWQFRKGEICLEDYIKMVWLKTDATKSYIERPSALHHIVNWYPHRHDDDVLWLHYEDLRENLRKCVQLIAEFLDIGANDKKLQELITSQSSIEFMKEHIAKFSDRPLKIRRNEALGLPRMAGLSAQNAKVREGLVDSAKKVIHPTTLEMIDNAWKQVVTPTTGHNSYDDLRNSINEELKRTFT